MARPMRRDSHVWCGLRPRHVRRGRRYGVAAALTGRVIELALTFRAGSAYCCSEWGCHLGLSGGRRWDGLRREVAAPGVPAPDELELRLGVVVEAGALFFALRQPDPARRGWYAFAPAE